MKLPFAMLAIFAAVSGPVIADETPKTLSVYQQDSAWAARFKAMFGQDHAPDWMRRATESEPVAVTLAGKPYTVLLACKQHDCADHQLVVLFDATTMYGVKVESRHNGAREDLHWYGMQSGPETVDGKTILYAAISGTLFNHPELFQYK